MVVFYNYFPDNTRISLTINGITQTVVNANIQHLTKKNHTSSVMKLTPETAESFGIEFEGSVPCQFVVIDPKIRQEIASTRSFYGFLMLGLFSTITGVAIFLRWNNLKSIYKINLPNHKIFNIVKIRFTYVKRAYKIDVQ